MHFVNLILPLIESDLPVRSNRALRYAIAEEWLEVEVIRAIPDSISNLLEPGERETIALALSSSETRILLDEREARKIAKSFDLRVIGTLGILILAKNSQIISQVKPPLEQMKKDAQYWVSDSLVRQILEQVEEL